MLLQKCSDHQYQLSKIATKSNYFGNILSDRSIIFFKIHEMRTLSTKPLKTFQGFLPKLFSKALFLDTQGIDELTHSCLKIYLTSVVWTFHTFEDNFEMKHKFAKYLKESCRLSSDEQFSFKYFLEVAFVREISSKLSDSFWLLQASHLSLMISVIRQ